MTKTAFYAPAHTVQGKPAPGNLTQNPDAAPSQTYLGGGLQDPRLVYNMANSATGAGIVGFSSPGSIKTCSQIPSTLSTTNISASAAIPVSKILALVTSSGAGITVVPAGGFVPFPNYGNVIPAGALAIDGLPTLTRFGSGFISGFYNPAVGIQRAVSVTAAAGATATTITINGADIYGFPMSQAVTVSAGATVNTTKTFKFITSIVANAADASHNYSIGTADVFGLGLAADYFADVDIYWNNAIQSASTFTAAVTTTASATTGDVRGTFTPGSSSNGTIRLDIFVQPSLARLANTNPNVGLFGVAQA